MAYRWLAEMQGYNLSTCANSPGSLPNPIPEGNISQGNTPISQFNKSQPFSASWNVTEHLQLLCGVTSERYGRVVDIENNVQLFGQSGSNSPALSGTDLLIAIDDDIEQAYMVFIYKFSAYTGYYYDVTTGTEAQRRRFYVLIQEGLIPPIVYTWQSVPAISGKNGILSLTTLKEESINDGNPVDDASASAFNNAPDSCSVGGIISKDLPIIEGDPTSVALKYNIPPLTDSTYTSVKLVAKKKKIPKSKTDGDRIIDISPSSGSITIKKLDELTKYYFVIFVEDNYGNKADSEPKDITTGEKPAKAFTEIVSISKGGTDYLTFTETVTVSKVT